MKLAPTLTLLAVAMFAPTAAAASSARQCLTVAPLVRQAIAAGLQHGARPGRVAAVRSRDYKHMYMVALQLKGPGGYAVFGTNKIGSVGMIFAVDGFARQFSDWGRLPDARSTDDGVDAAKACAR